MRFSIAAAVIAATDASVSVTIPKSSSLREVSKEESSFRDRRTNSNPSARLQRKHWTMPRLSETIKRETEHSQSILTNEKTLNEKEAQELESNAFHSNDIASESNPGIDGADLGILSSSSSSRRLEPELEGTNEGRPSSDFFDSFHLADPDKTIFYGICDNAYLCGTCDDEINNGTAVGAFDCRKVSCYEVDSRCPNREIAVCRYDNLKRTFDDEDNLDTSPYSTERCRRIETRLAPAGTNEEDLWEFTYCLRYSIVPTSGESPAADAAVPDDTNATDIDEEATPFSSNTCEMEIDGIVCSSCVLETFALVDEDAANDNNNEFCAAFDCGNTILGYSGRFCNARNLASNSIDYFVYKSLPCDGGCNLCGEPLPSEGVAAMNMMRFRDGSFSTNLGGDFDMVEDNSNNGNSTDAVIGVVPPPEPRTLPWPWKPTRNCFEAQWEALLGPTDSSTCQALQPEVGEACGCTLMGSTKVTTTKGDASASDDETVDQDDESSGARTGFAWISVETLVATASVIGFGWLWEEVAAL